MKKLFFAFLLAPCFFLYPQADSSLIISEVMFFPQGSNNEFVEIYNRSESQSIFLDSFKIKYSTSAPDVILKEGKKSLLLPKSYALIFEGDYDFQYGIYNNLIPQNTLILRIADNAFGSNGMSNTGDRLIQLLNKNNDTLDSYIYSADNTAGYSDEKVYMNNDTDRTNWNNSKIRNGTPGFRNSVTPFEYDLRISSIDITPQIIYEGENALISIAIRNSGLNIAEKFNLKIYNDLNLDSLESENEVTAEKMFSTLAPADSVLFTADLTSLPAGRYNLIVKLLYELEQNPADNKMNITLSVNAKGNSYNEIVINEIMYAPVNGEPEWIEIYNNTKKSINIKNWKIGDKTSSSAITGKDAYIQKYSYLIIAKDSSILMHYDIPVEVIKTNFPALNNDGDAVVLKDFQNNLIDSLSYLPAWGGNLNGRSLERIDVSEATALQSNWGSSLSLLKGTPGLKNSIAAKEYDLGIIKFAPKYKVINVTEPNELALTVKNFGKYSSGSSNLKIFLDQNNDSIPQSNELIKTIETPNLLPKDSVGIVFMMDNIRAGLNTLIAHIENIGDENFSNNLNYTEFLGYSINEERNDLVINEIMYAPKAGQAEWVELYNNSKKIINLAGYKMADNKDTAAIVTKPIIMNPGEYLIIASDSSIYNYITITSKTIVVKFPSLNNSEDKIILIDSLSRTIDSLQYYSTWGGDSGKSLERINTSGSSVDRLNWNTSISLTGGTPGKKNSVSPCDYDIAVSELKFDPEFPVAGDDLSLIIKIKNKCVNNMNFNLSVFEDANLDSIPDRQLYSENNLYLKQNDSVIVEVPSSIKNIRTDKGICVSVNSDNDEDTVNNYLYKQVKVKYPASEIVVNEIMYYPFGGEPEWIEFYNNSNDTVNITDWTVNDIFAAPGYLKITQNIIIQPKSYFVISKDSSIFNYHKTIPSKILTGSLPVLNNDEDGVVLKEWGNITIDSVLYKNHYGGTNGCSLERKSFQDNSNLERNWASSTDVEQSTPGRKNSISEKLCDLKIAELFFDPANPVYGDSVHVGLKIKNIGSAAVQNINVNYFLCSDTNRVNFILFEKQNYTSIILPDDSITIVSLTTLPVPKDWFLVAARAVCNDDEDTTNNYYQKPFRISGDKNSLIVNEILYSPKTNEPEWVELVNISGHTLNLNDWSISDCFTTPVKVKITNHDLYLQSGGYLVVTRDSSFYNLHSGISSETVLANFGQLNNDEDGIMVYDFRDSLITKTIYRSSWGGANGRSLERVSSINSANDSLNWKTSLSVEGCTPGAPNSNVNIRSFKRNDVIVNEIMFDPASDNCEYIEIMNISSDTVDIGGWSYENNKGILFNLSESHFMLANNEFFILAEDTLIEIKYPYLKNITNKNIIKNAKMNLGNSGDLILLKDFNNTVIDSVYYESSWVNKNIPVTKNKSLEKINPYLNGNNSSNWNTCVDILGGTPGKQNSLYTINLNNESSVAISPNPFSPDSDGFEDYTMIDYKLKQTISQVRIKIFDSKGRLLRTLLNSQSSGSNGTVVFNGYSDEGSPLRIGIYIVLLEAMNGSSNVVETLKTVVVIARKL